MTTAPDTSIRPNNSLKLLSIREMEALLRADQSLFQLFRQCALAVLNTGSDSDDALKLLNENGQFLIQVVQQSRGLKIDISNAPPNAFVDNQIMQSIQNHIFSALRDIIFTEHEINIQKNTNLNTSVGITDVVFRILRNANAIKANKKPNLVVCWGGHSIDRMEYDYSKEVGYRLGLRGLNIATGCGAGAMKGPMKGARIGHAKQNINNGRYLGVSEPGILVSEAPNSIVNELIILPDIEKRLEAFVRLSHAIIVFPGGVGTAEEIMYLLSIMLRPENANIELPIIFTAPEEKKAYFEQMDAFIGQTLGEEAQKLYKIIIGDPIEVSKQIKEGIGKVTQYRNRTHDLYGFNWKLDIPLELQSPFIPTHENMRELKLHSDLPAHELATNLRAAFSGIVAGNVKTFGRQQIAKHGLYEIQGSPEIMEKMDALLQGFVKDGRMKIGGKYEPCYKVI